MSILEEDREPNKVFVANLHYNAKEEIIKKTLRKHAEIIDVKIVRDGFGDSKKFGFVTVKTEEDAKRLINLPDKPNILGRNIVIKPAKKQHMRPYMPQFEKLPISDCEEYDLTPPDPLGVCGHILDDDSLFRILQYLPVKKLIQVEVVCKRWRFLVFQEVSKRFKERKHLLWDSLNYFDVEPSLDAVSKLLIIIGDEITKLDRLDVSKICSRNDLKNCKNMATVIGRLCPNLEELNLYGEWRAAWLTEILNVCGNIRSFGLSECRFSSLKDDLFNPLFTKCKEHLIELNLNTVWSKQEFINFNEIPETLRKLIILDVKVAPIMINFVDYFSIARCPNLTTFITDIHLSPSQLLQINEKCPHIEELGLTTVDFYLDEYEMKKLFREVRKLHLFGTIDPMILQTFIDDFPDLEELDIGLMHWRRHMDGVINFSKCSHLNILSLPSLTTLKHSGLDLEELPGENACTVESLKFIEQCKKLKKIVYMGGLVNLEDWFFKCIAACPLLTEIHLPRMRLRSCDEDRFIVANKTRASNIKLVLCEEINRDLSSFKNLKRAHYKLETKVGHLFGSELLKMKTDFDFYDSSVDGSMFSDYDDYSDYDSADDDDVMGIMAAADGYGFECLHLDDQKELMYNGYGGWGDSSDDDY